jgi:glutamyl-tRNA reductase
MQLYVFGINHRNASLEVREQVAFPAETLKPALSELVQTRPVEEAAILSTCNRTEIYCRTDSAGAVIAWLTHYRSLQDQHLSAYVYRLEGSAVARHAFRVACGLESMVLGEAQILGQMKQAVRAASEAGTLSWLLNKLFQCTFSVAKEVRSATEIGRNSVSMAAATLKLATSIFGNLREQSVLFVGAGEMIELCATHFAAQTPKRISVANRTQARAQELAERLGGMALSLSELPEKIAAHDIIVTCTASALPIVGKGLMERVIRQRRHRPVLMVDLAVPRDIEPEVGKLDDVFLYTIDDLGHIIQQGIDSRQTSVTHAEAIIEAHVASFMQWLEARELVPTIRQLRDHGETYRRAELERARRMLARGEDPEDVLIALSHGLLNKFLHHPTIALSRASGEEREGLVRLLNRLFTLPSSE